MIWKTLFAVSLLLIPLAQGKAADLSSDMAVKSSPARRIVSGRVAVIDGRTLWFASRRMLVTLNQIDSCDLPQWAFNPKVAEDENALYPVPCGGFAKAWLRRAIGGRVVKCTLAVQDSPTATTGTCKVAGHDLAYEMLRVGWARLATRLPRDNRYFEAQSHAVAARYGMWATYVLDMSEWRRKAIDKTLGRRPIADLNLLSERQSEISPPFADARRQPSRRDR